MKRAAVLRAAPLLLLAAACNAPAARKAVQPAAKSAPSVATEPQPAKDAAMLYGAPIDRTTPSLALADVMKAPEAYAGKTIRTEGQIVRVCQRMGCWMELQQPGLASALRVPMAGHAFFLPQSVQGKRAEVQGMLQIAKLSDAHRKHLESEGAEATTADVSLAATGVSVQ